MHKRSLTQKYDTSRSPQKQQHPIDLVDMTVTQENNYSPKFQDQVQTAKKPNRMNNAEYLQQRCNQLESQIMEQIQEKNKIIKKKDQEIEDLQEQLRKFESSNEETDHKRLEEENYYLQAEQQELIDQIEFWKRKHQNQADQCDVLRNTISKMKEEANQKIRSLKDELNEMEQYANDQIKSTRAEIRKVTMEKEKLGEQIKKQQSDQNQLISDYKIEQERLQKKLQLYEQSFNQNEDYLENLQQLTFKLEESNQMNQKLKQRISSLNLNQQELLKEIDQLKGVSKNESYLEDIKPSYLNDQSRKKLLLKIETYEAEKKMKLKNDLDKSDREDRKSSFNKSANRY